MDKSEQKREFNSAKHKAEEFAKDKEKAGYLLEEAAAKADRNRTVLEDVWKDLQTLFRLLSAWKNGDYDILPLQSIIFALASVVYFVNPFDIIPDFLPLGGYLDDATVLSFVLKSIKSDINQFLEWEKTYSATSSD